MNNKQLIYRVSAKRFDGVVYPVTAIYSDGSYKHYDEDDYDLFNDDDIDSYLYFDYPKDDPPVYESDYINAFITLCAFFGEPKSEKIEEYPEPYIVQFFGSGEPWRETEWFKNIPDHDEEFEKWCLEKYGRPLYE